MVNGLQSKPYLNYRVGTVLHSLPNDRYAVQLNLPWEDPVSGTTKNKPISLNRSNIVQPDFNIPGQLEELARIYLCAVCNKEVARDYIKKCSKCRRALYCSKDCQVRHWKKHKSECEVLRNGRKEKDPELPSIHDPQDRFTARTSRAFRFIQTGDGPSAEAELRRIIDEFDIQEHFPYSQLAVALLLQRRFDDALAVLQQAVQLPLSDGEEADSYAGSYAMIGHFLRRKNDPQGAMEALENALAIDPNHHEAREVMHALVSSRRR